MTAPDADARFRGWMRENLVTAAERFRATVVGPPVFGWLDRSISAPATQDGEDRWLRVVSEDPRWVHMDFWTGNEDANVLVGVPKPRVLDAVEWDEHRRQRAELMTRLPGRRCSSTDALRDPVTLDARWWRDLREALAVVSRVPTGRVNVDQERIDQRASAAFGDQVSLRVDHWETAHGDLHWANLLHPALGILDWEHWGRAPWGTDAATLYCYRVAGQCSALQGGVKARAGRAANARAVS